MTRNRHLTFEILATCALVASLAQGCSSHDSPGSPGTSNDPGTPAAPTLNAEAQASTPVDRASAGPGKIARRRHVWRALRHEICPGPIVRRVESDRLRRDSSRLRAQGDRGRSGGQPRLRHDRRASLSVVRLWIRVNLPPRSSRLHLGRLGARSGAPLVRQDTRNHRACQPGAGAHEHAGQDARPPHVGAPRVRPRAMPTSTSRSRPHSCPEAPRRRCAVGTTRSSRLWSRRPRAPPAPKTSPCSARNEPKTSRSTSRAVTTPTTPARTLLPGHDVARSRRHAPARDARGRNTRLSPPTARGGAFLRDLLGTDAIADWKGWTTPFERSSAIRTT